MKSPREEGGRLTGYAVVSVGRHSITPLPTIRTICTLGYAWLDGPHEHINQSVVGYLRAAATNATRKVTALQAPVHISEYILIVAHEMLVVRREGEMELEYGKGSQDFLRILQIPLFVGLGQSGSFY